MKLQESFLLYGKFFMHGISMEYSVFGIDFSYEGIHLAFFDGYNISLNGEVTKKCNEVVILKQRLLSSILKEYEVVEYQG